MAGGNPWGSSWGNSWVDGSWRSFAYTANDTVLDSGLRSGTKRWLELPGYTSNEAYAVGAGTVAGILDLHWYGTCDWRQGSVRTLIAKWDDTTPQGSYLFRKNGNYLQLDWCDPTHRSASSTIAISGFLDWSAVWMRVIRDPSSGVVQFYYSNNGTNWKRLGDVVATTAGPHSVSAANLEIGCYDAGLATGSEFMGRVYRAQVWNGVEEYGGTLVADFNPNDVEPCPVLTLDGANSGPFLSTGGPTFTAIPSQLAFNNVCTVEAMVRLRRENALYPQYILSSDRDMSPTAGGYALAVSSPGYDQAQVASRFWASNGSSYGTSATPLSLRTWHRVTGVWDGVRAKTLLDGVLMQQSGPINLPLLSAPYSLCIGALGYANAGLYCFDGDICDVRIWNTARTDAEIAGDWNGRLTGNETGLVAYYKLDDEDGPLYKDSTKYRNPARLARAAFERPHRSFPFRSWQSSSTGETWNILSSNIVTDIVEGFR